MGKINNRVREKELSRQQDLENLRNGVISPNELRKQNGFFSSIKFDKIEAIGKVKFKDLK
jgi:hypothetical protein